MTNNLVKMKEYKIVKSDNWVLKESIDKNSEELQEMISYCKKNGFFIKLVSSNGKVKLLNPDHIIFIEELR